MLSYVYIYVLYNLYNLYNYSYIINYGYTTFCYSKKAYKWLYPEVVDDTVWIVIETLDKNEKINILQDIKNE